MPRRLQIPQPIFDAVIAHARAEMPRECCGLLAGHADVASSHFPLVNTAAKPASRFESSPASMFAAVRAMRQLGLDIVAVYHSHPTTAAEPSATDREWNYSPQVVNIIASLATEPPDVRGWLYGPAGDEPVELAVGDGA